MTSSVQKPAKAIIFARVSSKNREEGYSLIAQVSRLQEYCKRNGLEVVYEFQLIETSTSADRAFVFNMLECIKNQEEPIALVVDGFNRLSRSFNEVSILQELRMSEKLTLHFVKENRVLNKHSNSAQLMAYQMCVVMAASHARAISDNAKRGIQYKLQNGECIGKAPIGYLNVRDTTGKTNVIIDAEKAPIIRQIFEMRANGSKISDIATTVSLKTAMVSAILTNPFYYGKMYVKSHDKLYPHNYERIVTSAMFDKCQAVMKKKGIVAQKYQR